MRIGFVSVLQDSDKNVWPYIRLLHLCVYSTKPHHLFVLSEVADIAAFPVYVKTDVQDGCLTFLL